MSVKILHIDRLISNVIFNGIHVPDRAYQMCTSGLYVWSFMKDINLFLQKHTLAYL